MQAVEIGTTGSIRCTVEPKHLATELATEPDENYPSVFSTPWVLALFEKAAAKVLRPVLEPGQLSVGARASIEHTAPTPLGSEVTAYARYLGSEGALHLFDVWAEDEGGPIGKGTHARAIVARAAVEKRAQKRCSEPASRADGFN